MNGFLSRQGLAAVLLLLPYAAFAASGGDDGSAPAPVGAPAPPAIPPLEPVQPFGGPPPGAAGMPGAADPGAPTADISSSPPPLSSLAIGSTVDAASTISAFAAATGPVETYEFLFREDDELGVVREKYSSEEAEQRRRAEIQRLIAKYQQPQTIGAPAQQQGVDPRAAAEWDFYFEQLQLYSEYVKTKVLRTDDADFPEPAYDAATALPNAEELQKTYNEMAVTFVNEQWNENREFYERLQERDDRRQDFKLWVQEQERNLQAWTHLWGRKAAGQTWTDGQPVNRDDWYYGVHANAGTPVLTEVGGQEFLLSRSPQHDVPPTTLNVLSTNLTPYDVVDAYGNLKSPEVERVRGNIVRPTPVAFPTTGTLELAF